MCFGGKLVPTAAKSKTGLFKKNANIKILAQKSGVSSEPTRFSFNLNLHDEILGHVGTAQQTGNTSNL